MSGHTPGPWEAVEGGFGRHWCVIGSKHQLIGDDVVDGADARLIAAAPELLETAKATRAWMDAAATRGAKVPMQAHELRVIVKNAIAKAEGRGEGEAR